MKTFIPLFCLAVFSLTAAAQAVNKTISGQIKDIQNEAVAGATIQLQKAGDSTALQKIMSKDNGKFIFTGLADGAYILNISFVGNKKYVSNLLTIDASHPTIILPVIIMLPEKQTALKEVIVTTKKPLIEQDIDRTIVNVDAMISSAASNALEVLEKTPGITINDGDINLNGRSGVMVLIDGRPTYMSATDLLAYLKSIPGSTLDKIELMSNPPAKYDAAGNAVINIRYKKNRMQGYAGSVSLSFAQGITNSTYNSLNLNYLSNKINVFGNISVNKDMNFDDDSYERIFYNSNYQKTTSTNLQNYYNYKSREFSGRMGMDFTLSDKTIIGFITSFYQRSKMDNMDSHSNSVSFVDSIADSSGYGNTKANSPWKQAAVNINLIHKFNNAGRELSADIDYINYNNKAKRILDNYIYANDGSTDSNYMFQYNLPSDIHIYTAKADYTHPLKNKILLSAGIKSSFIKNDNTSDYTDIINNNHVPDLSKSNHFIYTENINAVYINARKDWKRLGAQFGLRAENTNTKGNQLGNAVVPDSMNVNHYTGLFPSLFITYKLDSSGKNILSFNFSRRISRPNYQQLNPFLIFTDQYSYSTGNPFLGPSYNNNFELSYRYKQFANISFQYNRINNSFFNATQVADKIFITKPENADTKYMMAIIANLNLTVAKWWRANLNIGGANFVTKGSIYNQTLSENIYAYRFNILNQFVFKNGWSAELSSRYTSSIIDLQRLRKPRYQLDAGMQKKILKGRASVKLSMDDIFYTAQLREETTGLVRATAYHTDRQDSRRIRIAFSYNFGKEKFARKRGNNDTGADDIKERVN